ncbi:MAG: tetratricopeptide repeat protein [Acidobacteria bacterium]|nr:tetratricopeptide repeat protein [Acidobacteriota bacterium]
MKRCPQCRSDYYDDSLQYCLEDGTALVQGSVPSPDEPATAILGHTGAPAEAATAAQIHTTESTAILESAQEQTQKRSYKASVLAIAALAMIALGGFLVYRYLTATKQIGSIAVMPFVNEGGNADMEYLSDGMTETLIRSLSNLADLDVKPRSAVFRYKGKDVDASTIARELNVQGVLNGRVVERGDQLTLSLELIDARRNRVIWGEQYERKAADLVSLQSEIAKDVSTKLMARLSGAEENKVTKAAAADPEAYQAYLRGRYYWNRRTGENLRKAIEQFKIATDRDPNFSLAFAGLADCYAILSEYTGTPTSETAPQAKLYAERALALDPSMAEPHAALGQVNALSWKWPEAEQEYKRAIELNPSYATAYHWYATTLSDLGRSEEALAMIQRGHELEPMSSIIRSYLSNVEQTRNNHEAAIQNALQLIELDPNFGNAYAILAISYAKTGRLAEAVAAAEKAAQLQKRNGESLGNLGYVYALAGRKADSLAIIKELEERYARNQAIGQNIADVYAGLGDKDKAFEWLDKDFQKRDGNLPDFRPDLEFESLRQDPRYKDLLRRIGLPE